MIARIYHGMKKGSDGIEGTVKAISAVLLFLCFVSVLLQVINRYVLVKQTVFPWKSISWTDELARYLMIASAYMAMNACYKHGQLSRADMVFSRLRPLQKKILYLAEFVMICVFLGAAIRYGIEFARANVIYRSESLRIPGNVLYMIPVVGFVLMGYQAVTECFGVLCGEILPFDSIVPSEDGESV